jgi:hypothetical protein
MTTIYKHFSGLTPTAAKCPAFPSANRYSQCKEKNKSIKLFLTLNKKDCV